MKYIDSKIFILSLFLLGINSFYLFSQIDSTSVDNDTKEIYKLVIESKFSSNSFDSTGKSSDDLPVQIVINDSTTRTIGQWDDFISNYEENHIYNSMFKSGCKHLKINKKNDFFIDFINKNKGKIQLAKNAFPFNLKVNLLNILDFEKSVVDTINFKYAKVYYNRENFYSKFPFSSGFIQVSQIGFSKKNDKSMLYASQWCNGRWSSGWWFILKKKNNKWIIIKSYELWIS